MERVLAALSRYNSVMRRTALIASCLLALAAISWGDALAGGLPGNPDAEIAYVPPRRVIAPPVYSEPGPVIFPMQPLPDGTFCSPPYDFCEPEYVNPVVPQ